MARPYVILLKMLPPNCVGSAEAFAKGGDSEEHLEVSLFRLRIHNSPSLMSTPS